MASRIVRKDYEQLGGPSNLDASGAVLKLQKAARLASQHAKESKVAEEHPDFKQGLERGELVPFTCALLHALRFPTSKIQSPEWMLQMASELLVLVNLAGGIITKILHPETYSDNPLLRAFGYNNLCVGLDLPPARYVAAFGWVLLCHCALSACGMQVTGIIVERASGRERPHSKYLDYLFMFCHIGFAICTVSMILCFLIPPTVSRRWHTRPFLAYIVFKSFSQWATVYLSSLEIDARRKKFARPGTQKFAYFFIIWSIVYVTNAELIYWWHDKHPDAGPLTPWQWSFCLDWGWMVVILISGSFIPKNLVVIDGKVFHPETLESMHTAFGHKASKKPKQGMFANCCGKKKNKSDAIMDADLLPEHLEVPASEKEVIDKLCAQFNDAERQAAAKFPQLPSGGLACGLTLTVLKAKLTIDKLGILRPWHRHGLLKEPKTYDASVRIGVTAPGGTRMSIRLEVPESMGLLSENKTEKNASGHRGMDILLAEGMREFFIPQPSGLLHLMKIANSPSIGSLVSGSLSDLTHAVANIPRAKAAISNTTGVFGKDYYSGLPFMLGERGACKFCIRPQQEDKISPDKMIGKPGDSLEDKEEELQKQLAELMVGRIKGAASGAKPYKFDFCVQLAKKTFRITEGDEQWDEKVSPYIPVGTFEVLIEPALAGGIKGQNQAGLFFNVWNTIEAHKPVGALNLARQKVYPSHQESRKAEGGGLQEDRVCPYLANLGIA